MLLRPYSAAMELPATEMFTRSRYATAPRTKTQEIRNQRINSPVGDGAVRPLQHRHRPFPFRDFRDEFQGLEVQSYPESRTAVRPHLSVLEVVAFRQMRESSLTLTQHLHQHWTRKNRADMHQSCFRDRSREVRDQAYIMGLTQGEHLQILGDPSHIGQRHAGIIDQLLLDQPAHVPFRSELLPDCDRYFDVGSQFAIRVGILRADEVLREIRLER